MRAAIIGLPRGEIDPDAQLETDTSQEMRALVVEEYQYLDGVSIYSGTATGRVKTTTEEIHVGDGFISTGREETIKDAVTDFYADFDAGFIGVDSGDGEFLWNRLGTQLGTSIERAEFNLDAFAEKYEQRDTAECWQIGYKHDSENVGVRYHDDARVQTFGVTQLGFEYLWNNMPVRGTVAASGYVAIYSTMTVEEFGRWLRDELLPHTSLPEDEQSELTEDEQDALDEADDAEVTECEVCGREPEKGLEETEAGMLCVVCADRQEEKQQELAEEKLADAKATDGGWDDE